MKNFENYQAKNAAMAEMTRAFLRVAITRRNVRHNYTAISEWFADNNLLPSDVRIVMVQSPEALRHLVNSLVRTNPTLTLNNVVMDGHHYRTRFVVIDGTTVYGYHTYRKMFYDWGNVEALATLLKTLLVTGETPTLYTDDELAEHSDWVRTKWSMLNAIERVGAEDTESEDEDAEEKDTDEDEQVNVSVMGFVSMGI